MYKGRTSLKYSYIHSPLKVQQLKNISGYKVQDVSQLHTVHWLYCRFINQVFFITEILQRLESCCRSLNVGTSRKETHLTFPCLHNTIRQQDNNRKDKKTNKETNFTGEPFLMQLQWQACLQVIQIFTLFVLVPSLFTCYNFLHTRITFSQLVDLTCVLCNIIATRA